MKKMTLFILCLLMSASFLIVEVVGDSDNGITIYIDPGHGGSDGGAIGYNEVYEKEIVLDISLKLARLLKDNRFRVEMTRDTDVDLAPDGSKNRKVEDIHKRTKLINNSDCALYVSIHANSFPSKSSYGAQVFYNPHNEESKELAKLIQDSFVLQLGNTYRVSKSITGIYLIDKVSRPGCLIEVGFLSNPKDLELLKDGVYQDKIATSIYLGINEYLKKSNKI